MAKVTLMPGYGGKYTSESIANTTGADTIDTAKVAQFAVQVEAVTGSPTIQVTQTFDGTNFANIGNAITPVVGSVARFGPTGGPYGVIQFVVTGGGTAATLLLVGFPNQGSY